MSSGKLKKILLKILKGIGWFLLGLVVFLVVIILSLRIPKVQQFITEEAVKFFKNKVDTEASIGRLYVDFPKTIVIEDIYVEDLQGDTLVYGQYIAVDTDLWGLLESRFEINELEAKKLVANIYNSPQDSTFNYQFIVDAFAPQPDTVPQDTASASFTFAIYEADIQNSRVNYSDLYNGTKLLANIGSFYTNLSEFNLENLVIGVDEITLKNSHGEFVILKPSESDTTTTAMPDISGKSLLVENVKFTFEDKPGGMKVVTDIGQVKADIDEINLTNQVYKADEISILNSFVSVDQFSTADTIQVEADTVATGEIQLLASTKKGEIKNTSFRYYDHTAPKVQGFDPSNLWFQQINADLEAIKFENGYTEGKVNALAARERGGLALEHFEAGFKYGKSESYAQNLELRTVHSDISGEIQLTYPSIEALQNNPKNVIIDAKFSRSRLHLGDLFYFQPALKSEMPQLADEVNQVIFKGNIEGQLADLNVRSFEMEALGSTRMVVTGNIEGLPDMDQLYWDVKLKELTTSRKDISSVVPDTLIPPDITLPSQIKISGTSQGSMNDFKTRMNINTSYGQAMIDARLMKKAPELYAYNGRIEVDEFNIGSLLNQEEQIGAISLNANIDGEGFSMEDINTEIKGEISSVVYNQYNYENLSINGNVRSMQFQGDLAMEDPNLNFDFHGLVNLNDSIPKYNFTLDLKNLDLQALNFSEDDIRIRARVVSDIQASAVEDINGTLEIENLMVSRGEESYRMDTFLLSATTTEEITDITIFSNIIDAQFKGNFDIVTLPDVLQKHINRYYSLAGVEDVKDLETQQFEFSINVKRPRFFSEILVPGLQELETGPIKGTYDSDEWALDINISVPKIVYTGTIMDSLKIHLYSNEEYFGYETRLAKIGTGNIGVENIHLEGIVEADHIETDLMIKDEEGENKYMFGGIFISGEEYYRFQFTPGEFILNYVDWKVKPSNTIDFYPTGIWVQNMILTHEEQRLAIESAVNQKNDSILSTDIENFDLRLIGKLEETKGYVIGGVLDGDIDINMQPANFAFTSDLNIENFSFKGDTLGNIMLQANQVEGNKYNLDLELKSDVNDLTMQGYYIGDSIPDMNFDVNLIRLDLATIESFAMGQLEGMEGFLNGDLQVKGTIDDPDITGVLRFNNTSFSSALLGSKMSINNETIRFTKSGISFDSFVIRDINNNTARIDGKVLTQDYVTYELNLDVNTDDFLLLNTTAEDNELFYGAVEVSSRTSIRGTSEQPDIRINVSLKDDSHLTYVIPEEEVQLQEREGVVEFFDKDLEEDPFYDEGEETSAATDSITATLKGISLTAKIDVNRSNTFSVIIDPVTGDKLTVQGDANLTFGIKPSGDMTMTGRYEVYEGQYNLNFYGLVKREFDIAQGSYLIWTGDPLNARVDITATHTVSAVYEMPGSNEVASQRVPFIVYLDIENQLLNPDISFRLGLAEDAAAQGAQTFVATVNKDQNQLNTQVFYLLLFKTTKGLQSYGTVGAGGSIAESTARSSASRILSNQLNKLAGRIEGVELSLDLQSYNTTGDPSGGTTQLELGLSKQLFDNRVVVKVAGNFGLEGQEAEQQQNLSDFAGDIRIEYKLTKDGRFRLVGFRENEYDNLLQGEIIKTGAGVIFVRDYDAFKELFSSVEEENKEESE